MAVLDAIQRRDITTLRSLALNEQEFREHIWPELPASRPERNLPFSYVWGDLHQKSEAALAQTLARHGGRRYMLVSVRFAGESTRYPSYTVYRGDGAQGARRCGHRGRPASLRVKSRKGRCMEGVQLRRGRLGIIAMFRPGMFCPGPKPRARSHQHHLLSTSLLLETPEQFDQDEFASVVLARSHGELRSRRMRGLSRSACKSRRDRASSAAGERSSARSLQA